MTSSPKQRVLLIRNAASYDFGGGERFPVHLAQELQNCNYDVTVVSGSEKLLHYAAEQHISAVRGWWWSNQNWAGIRALLFPFYFVWQCTLTVWYVQLILHLKSDIVHAQSRDDFVAATIGARLLGKRIVWTDHADLKYIFANHQVWYKNPVGKLVYIMSRHVHAITLVSQSEERLIEEALGFKLPANFSVVYNGVTETPVSPIDTQKPQDSLVFCTTSRLVTAKGIGELVEAFRLVQKTNPQAILWLVGDGPERDKFEAKAAGSSGITFFGHSDEPLRYVAACDIFVHPSYHEGFSLSLVEAAMLAKPIIACNVGGNPEIIQDGSTGLLIPANDAQALSTAMLRLIADQVLRQRLGSGARSRFETDFEFTRIVREGFIPLYEQTTN